MNSIKRATTVCLLLLVTAAGYSQFTNFSNRGKEFWVGYGQHQYMYDGAHGGPYDNSQQMVLYIATQQDAATVTVQLDKSGTPLPPPNGGPWTRTYTMPANTVLSIEDPMPAGVTVTKSPTCIQAIGTIPKGRPTATPGESGINDCGFDARLIDVPPSLGGTWGERLFQKKGIHITSTAPIVVYAHIYGSVASGATMLMPVETWGYNYTCANSMQKDADYSNSWMFVVANSDHTKIEITPSATSILNKPAGVPFTVRLNRGEIYQLLGANTGPQSGYELTGTTVKSIANDSGKCFPVAVFCGSGRTSGEDICSAGSRDNDIQQLFPQEAWGKQYLTAPLSTSNSASSFMSNVYKVIVSDPTTVVKRNGTVLGGFSAASKSYRFQSSTADYITADKPIMVAQYMGGDGGPCNPGEGDPEMMYLSPVEQAIKSVGFYRNNKQQIDYQYLTLIIPTAGVNTLKIDGTLFSSIAAGSKYSYPHPNRPGYTVCIRRWSATKAQSFASSDSAFNAVTYGEGGAESYGYNAGTYVFNLNALTTIHNTLDTTRTEHPFTCTGTPVQLCQWIAYVPTQIIWNLGGIPGLVQVTSSGNVPVPAYDTLGDGINPIPYTQTDTVDGRPFYKFCIGDSPHVFMFANTGTFTIPDSVQSPLLSQCNPWESFTMEVVVKQKPSAAFTYLPNPITCASDTVHFTGASSGNGYTLSQWFWEIPAGTPYPNHSQNVGYVFPTPGTTYPVKLAVASDEGCYADTIINVAVPPNASTSFTVSDTAVCLGTPITFTPGPTTTTMWYWNFGDGVIDSFTNGNPFTHTYAAPGTYIILHSIKGSGSCNPTATDTVRVYDNPIVSFTYPVGCLPPNGIVNFNGSATTTDGQNITAWQWNFGDPNANAGNPNISTLQNPSHTYQNGSYTVTLSAFTGHGCVGDTVVNITLNLSPVVQYNFPTTSVCKNTAPFSVDSGKVINGVPGTGFYIGPGTSAAGVFDPSLANIGVNTIWYYFTSTAGCKDSASITITVNDLPVSSFTYPTGCLGNLNITFTATSSVPTGNTATYTWDFGDPASGAANTGTGATPTHTYPSAGPWNIQLVTTTNSGCKDSTTVSATFNLRAQLNYPPLAPVCGNATGVSVATATVTNGVTGTGVYSGHGTDAAGNFDPTVAGPGTHTITYVFTSTGGCVDSITQTISVSQRPKAGFTYPTTCLVNGTVQFTDTSHIPAGLSATYSWNFGEPSSGAANTSSLQNPSHTYAAAGTYQVQLLLDVNGCLDSTIVPVDVKIQPQLNYPPLANVCANVPAFSVGTATITNGVAGAGSYHGTGITDTLLGIFDPAIAGVGTHNITYVFTSAFGCIDSASRPITVMAVPIAGFSFPTTCLPNLTVQFTDTSVASGTPTYNWDFGDPSSGSNTSTAQSPQHVFTGSGPFNVQLIVNASGCSDTALTPVTVRVQPVPNYPALASVCANVPAYSIATATVTNSVAGTGSYHGAGVTDTLLGTFDPAIAGVGTHTITYIFYSSLGCVDSTTSSITVKAVPDAGFTFPTACLPNGTVQFTDTSIVPGPATYSWNFGETSSGSSNTSTNQNPQHTYSSSGPFNVQLVVNANGCSDSTTVPVTVRIQPVLNYAPLASVCANAPAYSIATATVTNGVAGAGSYHGAGVTDTLAGTFNPTVAGVGPHTITYIFYSSLGCVDSTTSSITVKVVPDAGFTFPTACLPNGTVQFTDTSIVPGPATYSWNFGETSSGSNNTSTNQNPQHTYSSSGPFNVKLVVNANGCSDSTTVPVTVRVQPVPNYPALASVCANIPAYSIATATVTNGVAGAGSYHGAGVTDTLLGTFNPTVAGVGAHTITYIFYSSLGCVDSTTSSITVKAVPDAGFTFPTACLPTGTVQFTDTSIVPGPATYSWNFGEPSSGAGNTSTGQNPQHSYSSAGPFNVKEVVTSNGCSDSTTTSITVRVKPVLNYPILTAVCANVAPYSIGTATVTNGVPKLFAHYAGSGITDSINGIFDPSIAGVGSHTIWYYFTSTLGCTDSVSQTITVRTVPVASFTYPTNCLPNGIVQFNASPVTGATYLWNFGDPGSPNNSSTQANPTHNYTTFSTYTITLHVSSGGCSDDTSVTTVFRIKPQLSYSALPSVCMTPDTMMVNTGSVTNAVPGHGIYTGPGVIDTLGHFVPSIAGAGPHTIWFIYTSTLGCVDSISRVITVYPKPVADFNLGSTNICADTSVTITNASTIASGAITNWYWDYGDGTSDTLSNGNPIVKSYGATGAYSIQLIVASNNNCVSDPVVKTLNVRALPVADFMLPPNGGVCMPNGNAAFTNASTIQGEDPSTLSYVWNFGDGSAPSTATDPAHVYNSTGTGANVALQVVSAYGCVSDTIKRITFFSKPLANFVVKPDTLCQGAPNLFFDLSTAPGSFIVSRKWDFGDGTTDTIKNPVKTFIRDGSYKVFLTVTNTQGCFADTFRFVRVYLQPIVDAGLSIIVPQGQFVTLNPVVNSTTPAFEWTPSIGLSNPNALHPTFTATGNITYTLTATGQGGCTASDSVHIDIMRPITIPNTFSPNGDGVNDKWNITHLQDYPYATVEVFNRYGQKVFGSYGGYPVLWDGTKDGKPLPVGTYYYVINLRDKVGSTPYSGYVVILR